MPGFVPFQHAKLVDEPPSGAAWLHEIKFDGYRVQLRVEHGRARLHTRNGHDWTERFPELMAAAARIPQDVILDGELCALGADGQPSFSALRSTVARGRTAALVFYAFDILWRGQDDLARFALKDRKALLAAVLDETTDPRLRLVEPLPQSGPALLAAACRLCLEGIVSKRRDSPYLPGRSEAWVKAKCRLGQEVVIGGWVQAPQSPFRAILAGVYDDGRLRYVGSVKSGFSRTPDLPRRLEALERASSPFEAGEPPRKTREVHWAEPRLSARVDFAEWTASGKLRLSSYKGLREDKDPREVVRERPADVL
jgi:bifunctional non-homologous end joining protein LigD